MSRQPRTKGHNHLSGALKTQAEKDSYMRLFRPIRQSIEQKAANLRHNGRKPKRCTIYRIYAQMQRNAKYKQIATIFSYPLVNIHIIASSFKSSLRYYDILNRRTQKYDYSLIFAVRKHTRKTIKRINGNAPMVQLCAAIAPAVPRLGRNRARTLPPRPLSRFAERGSQEIENILLYIHI